MAEKAWQTEHEVVDHIAPTVRIQREMKDEGWLTFTFGPAHKMPLHIFRLALATSPKGLWKCPHRHTRRCVTWMIPKSFENNFNF